MGLLLDRTFTKTPMNGGESEWGKIDKNPYTINDQALALHCPSGSSILVVLEGGVGRSLEGKVK